jgi:hypothetical protein
VAEDGEYERGVAAGQVLARLDAHDVHLARINGSMSDVAEQLKLLNMGVQRLADAAASDRATVITTAEALEKAEAARRDKSEIMWTPFARLIAIIAALAAVATVVGVLLSVQLH